MPPSHAVGTTIRACSHLASPDCAQLRAVRATRVPEGHRGLTRVEHHSSVRWIHIMNPVPPHSADPEECGGPPGQPARTRRRPQRYTQARNRECPEVTDLAVVSGELGVKLAAGPGEFKPRRSAAGQGGRGLNSPAAGPSIQIQIQIRHSPTASAHCGEVG